MARGSKVHSARDAVQRHMRDTAREVVDVSIRPSFKDLARIRAAEFRELELARARQDVRYVLPVVEATTAPTNSAGLPKPPKAVRIDDDDAMLDAILADNETIIDTPDERHPDTLGVYRQPEPKSIYSPIASSRNGSIPKPKTSTKVKGNEGGKVKLWQGNNHKQLDPYMYRTSGRPYR